MQIEGKTRTVSALVIPIPVIIAMIITSIIISSAAAAVGMPSVVALMLAVMFKVAEALSPAAAVVTELFPAVALPIHVVIVIAMTERSVAAIGRLRIPPV